MHVHHAVLGFAQVVDGLGIGLVGDGGIVGLCFGAEGKFHDGGETHLGIGIGQGLALHHGQRGDGDLLGVHGGVEVGIGEDVNHGVLRLVLDGVGDLDGIGGSDGILGLGNHQAERFHEGNLDGAVVVEGDDQHGVGLLDVLDEAVLHGGAGKLTQVGGLAAHGHIEVPVLHFELGRLVEGEVLAVHLEDLSVDGPAQLAGRVLHHGKHAGGFARGGGDVQGDHVAVPVGDGDALGRLLHLLDILTQGNGLDSLHLGLQVADFGLQRGDTVAEIGVIILLGTRDQEQRHCKSR